MLTVDHKEAYPQPFLLPLGLIAKLKTIITNSQIELASKGLPKKREDEYCLLSAQHDILAKEGAICGWAPGQSFWESRVKPHGYNGLIIKRYYTNGKGEDFISWTRGFYDLLFTGCERGQLRTMPKGAAATSEKL